MKYCNLTRFFFEKKLTVSSLSVDFAFGMIYPTYHSHSDSLPSSIKKDDFPLYEFHSSPLVR